MKNAQATTILVFDWATPLDTDMKVGSSHVFAHDNNLGEISARDRVLIAGTDLPSPIDGAIDPKRSFWLLFFKLVAASPVGLEIRLLVIYEKLLLREIENTGAHALQQSARTDGEIQTVGGRVQVLAPLPAGEKRTDEMRRKILGAAAQERELGAARRKANAGWRIGHNPGRNAYFSDRGRSFQSDRGRHFSLIADGRGGARKRGVQCSSIVRDQPETLNREAIFGGARCRLIHGGGRRLRRTGRRGG